MTKEEKYVLPQFKRKKLKRYQRILVDFNTDNHLIDAFTKAVADSGNSASEVAKSMIIHCLRNCGYLK